MNALLENLADADAAETTVNDVRPAAGEVRVWIVDLAMGEGMAALRALLSSDELDRAARFRFPRDAQRFIVGRAALRQILGRALGVVPVAVEFAYGAAGKPAVRDMNGTVAVPPDTQQRSGGEGLLEFNVSHHEDTAVIALGVDGPVGIDLEGVRSLPEWRAIAQRQFPAETCCELDALPESERPLAFFAAWTQLEARSKAAGCGLGETPPEDAARQIATFRMAPSHVVSLAVPADTTRFSLSTWNPITTTAAAMRECTIASLVP